MALTFDVSGINNNSFVCTSPQTRGSAAESWHPVTTALVHAAMTCGFSSITSTNSKKVAQRIASYQKVVGPLLHHNDGGIYITEADVVAHIGLRTNASQYSDAKWNGVLVRMLARESETIMTGAINTRSGPLCIITGQSGLSAHDRCERLHALKLKSTTEKQS